MNNMLFSDVHVGHRACHTIINHPDPSRFQFVAGLTRAIGAKQHRGKKHFAVQIRVAPGSLKNVV